VSAVPPVTFVGTVSSTQEVVRTWETASHGAALVARVQTAGRGRLGRAWVAAPGEALMMSVLLRPMLPPGRLALVSLAAGVALTDVLGAGFGLKWPNDVLAEDGRKVAGILAELESTPQGPVVVLGVGVNVRGAPPLDTATSLLACGHDTAPEALANAVRDAILARTDELRRDVDGLLDAWRARSFTLGRAVRVGEVTGVAIALQADGALVLRDDAGEHVIRAGDVEMIGAFPAPSRG